MASDGCEPVVHELWDHRVAVRQGDSGMQLSDAAARAVHAELGRLLWKRDSAARNERARA